MSMNLKKLCWTVLHMAVCLVITSLLTTGVWAQTELVSNGDFESGDTTDWESLPTGASSFTVESGSPFAGGFNGKVENAAEASAAIIRQVNLGVGIVTPFEEVTVSFWARGSGENGGVHFAELFSEGDGGGVSKSEILGGGPLFPTSDTVWTFYSFDTTLGADVSGGVTLLLNATTGANIGSTSTLEIDNVSINLGLVIDFLGDVNMDGAVDFSDIPAFIAVLTSGVFQAEADCNQDGVVDFSDIPPFIAILVGS